jgi:Protein of unknown function (DUF3662)/FHA domain
MKPLRAFESMIANLVEGTFGRLFRSEVRPIELAHKLAREMDEHTTTSVARTYGPNEYSVWLSPQDRARYQGVEQEVIDELCAYLLEHARREGLALASAPSITFHTDDSLALGEFGIKARLVRASELAPDRSGPAPSESDRVAAAPGDGRGARPAAAVPAAGPAAPAASAAPGASTSLPESPAPAVPAAGPAASGVPAAPAAPGSASPSGPAAPQSASALPPAPAGRPAGVQRDGEPREERGQTMIYSDAEHVRGPLEEADGKRLKRALLTIADRRVLVPPRGGVIGRSRECDIVIEDAGISRRHAELRPYGEGWVVSDLGSTNGLRVNGRIVEGPQALSSGDRLELGSTEILFESS